MTCKYKITVVGTGYVGMSMAALLGQHNDASDKVFTRDLFGSD